MVSPPTRIIHTYTAHRTHTHTAHTHTPHTHTHTQFLMHSPSCSGVRAGAISTVVNRGAWARPRGNGCVLWQHAGAEAPGQKRRSFPAPKLCKVQGCQLVFFIWPAKARLDPCRPAGKRKEGRRAGGQEGKRRGWSENVCACACSCMCVKSIPGKHAMANGLYMCACGRQGERDPWHLVFRGELPDEFFAGDDGNTHQECLMPRGGMLHSMQQVTPHTHTYTHIHTHTYTHTHTQHTLSCCKGKGHVKIKHASQKLKDFEQDLFHYLQELRDLPFYPGYRRCNADNMFFCKHP